jgi:hypothetical protein
MQGMCGQDETHGPSSPVTPIRRPWQARR